MENKSKQTGWGAERAARLDNPERRAVLPPKETLEKVGLQKGMDFADIGCGVGYFTLPAARLIGTGAKAYALDVSSALLDILKEKTREEGIGNIVTVLSDAYDMKLAAETADFALCCNVVHEIEDQKAFLREIARVVKQGGTLAVIEWKMVRGEKGPRMEERIPPGDLESLLRSCGFDGFEQKDINSDLYAVIAKKI